MIPIGGFLDLEIARTQGQPYHHTVALSTGRGCLSQILQTVKPTKIYLPYYTCDALLAPIIERNIEYEFYKLDDTLEIDQLPKLLTNSELLIYINYFGLKNSYSKNLQKKYGHQLIIDDTHAFFQKGYKNCWSFNSARKFFGVPDSAYLYHPTDCNLQEIPLLQPNYDYLIKRMLNEEDAYPSFLKHESEINCKISLASRFSTHILSTVDYNATASCRRKNYHYLHQSLKNYNLLNLPMKEGEVPIYYPFLSKKSLHKNLIDKKIYIPKLWPEVGSRLSKGFNLEKKLARNLTPLPIDQRYNTNDMLRIVNEIKELIIE